MESKIVKLGIICLLYISTCVGLDLLFVPRNVRIMHNNLPKYAEKQKKKTVFYKAKRSI